MNELTGDILRHEEKISSIIYRLNKLKNANCFTAEVEIRIGDTRYTSKEYLNREEVVSVLERRLVEEMAILEKFKNVFEEENKLSPDK